MEKADLIDKIAMKIAGPGTKREMELQCSGSYYDRLYHSVGYQRMSKSIRDEEARKHLRRKLSPQASGDEFVVSISSGTGSKSHLSNSNEQLPSAGKKYGNRQYFSPRVTNDNDKNKLNIE